MVRKSEAEREREVEAVLATRRRHIRWARLTVFIAVVAVFSALSQGEPEVRQRLAGVGFGLLAWVLCTGIANAPARWLLERDWSPERVQVVTSATLGALQGLTAAAIGNYLGAGAGLPAGAGWLAGGALATVVGLLQWLSSLTRTDDVGAEARHVAATAPPPPLPQQTAIWLLLGVTYAVWVGLAADDAVFGLVAVVVQAALLAALALSLQRRRPGTGL